MSYDLIALDMDGTLLDSKKKITPLTLKAIDDAFDQEKHVVLSTGRCMAELNEYLEIIPNLRYIIGTSGGMVYDIKEKHMIYNDVIAIDQMHEILETVKEKDLMIHILSVESIVQEDKIPNMDTYGMGIYRPMYEAVCTKVENIYDFFNNNEKPYEKINLYHKTKEDRADSFEKLKHMPLELKLAEGTSLEISPRHVNKGNGLKKLCDHLNIDIANTIAVGDADNDTDILKVAGLPVAMGNALENIKEMCKVVVNDNDNDGCAQAIYDYLLK